MPRCLAFSAASSTDCAGNVVGVWVVLLLMIPPWFGLVVDPRLDPAAEAIQ